MVQDDPVVLFADVGAQQGRGELRVVVGAEHIADVVQQGAYHGLFVGAIPFRPRGGLQ